MDFETIVFEWGDLCEEVGCISYPVARQDNWSHTEEMASWWPYPNYVLGDWYSTTLGVANIHQHFQSTPLSSFWFVVILFKNA